MHFICYEWSEEIFIHMESNFLFQGGSIFYFKEFISYINIYQKRNKPIYIYIYIKETNFGTQWVHLNNKHLQSTQCCHYLRNWDLGVNEQRVLTLFI